MNRIEPLAAGISPMIALHSVVLPMPLRPTSESTPCRERQIDPLQRVAAAVEDVEASDFQHRRAAGRRRRSAMAASEIQLLHLADRPRSRSGGPSLKMRPLCIIVTLSTTRSATSMSCSMMM